MLLTASVCLGVMLAASGIAQPLSNALYDGFSKRTAASASRDILIVAIDDASIDAIGRWPWSRQIHADMIARIAAGHPRAIAYDVLFTEAADPRDDAALARAVHGAGRVVLPILLEIPGPNGADVAVKRPIAALRQAGADIGHSNVAVDRDGVLRRVALRDVGVSHLAAVAAGQGAAASPHPALIAFAKAGAFRTIPFIALARGDVPSALLRDKIVIVGATAAGLGDRYATPLTDGAGLTPGVETIAAITADVVAGRLIADGGLWGQLLFVAPVLLCLAMAFRLLTPVRSALVMLALMLLCLMGSAAALHSRIWLDPVPAMLALSFFFPVWGWYRLARVSGFVDRQIVRLAADRGPLEPAQSRTATPDRLEWRTALLDQSIGRMRDLRAFIDSSFENLPDATLVIDGRGRILLASLAARALFRCYGDGALPRSAGVALRRVLPAIVAGDAALAAILSPQSSATTAPREVAFRDERSFQIEASRFVAAASSASFTILRLVDITARKRAERDRQHALEFLSHDIRAPQTTLLGMIAQLDDRNDSAAKANIARLARRTLSLAQSFVDIARAQSDRLDFVPTDLADVLRESIDLLWTDSKAKSVRIQLTVPDDEALVMADGLLLARAFQNLLTNAIRHAPSGSAIAARVVSATDANGALSWLCKIDDRGPGIARATIATLFARFETGERRTGGTGLGLSLVKAVCTALGGDVRCYSKPGIGTRFVIRLPQLTLDAALRD